MNFGAFHLPTAITTALVVIGAIVVVLYLKKKLS
jgi:hypothetical protein